jgi:hypothetical protein
VRHGEGAFREQGLLFPRRPRGGPVKASCSGTELTHSHVIQILRSPRYAGAFTYGRTRSRKKIDGEGRNSSVRQPREQWHTLPNARPSYISWEEYEENLQCLRENAQAQGTDRRKSPPREGPALLQGLALCGICGKRMTIRYHVRGDLLVPEYLCQKEGIARAEQPCQRIPGADIDAAVGPDDPVADSAYRLGEVRDQSHGRDGNRPIARLPYGSADRRDVQCSGSIPAREGAAFQPRDDRPYPEGLWLKEQLRSTPGGRHAHLF